MAATTGKPLHVRSATEREIMSLPGEARRVKLNIGKPLVVVCRECRREFEMGDRWNFRFDDETVSAHLFEIDLCPSCGENLIKANPQIRIIDTAVGG